MHDLPQIVISTDFEMGWGIHDIPGLNLDKCKKILENQYLIIPGLLKIFSERSLRASWACVGAIGCKNWQEYFKRAPQTPHYENDSLGFKPVYAEKVPEGEIYFFPQLLDLINSFPGQELGTHTFSHIYMREPGINEADVRADIMAASVLWQEKFGFSPKSLAFPKNQQGFLALIRSSSIKIWRGNEKPWYYNCQPQKFKSIQPRSLRLFESINPVLKRAAAIEQDMTRSSLFLRLNLPQPLWVLHMMRIKYELQQLLPGEIFHIWFHPHDVFSVPDLNRVRQVMDLIAERCQRQSIISSNMFDLVCGS